MRAEEHTDWHELLRASSVGQAYEQMERAGILCSGPLGFHKPSQFSTGEQSRCLACDKQIYEDEVRGWVASCP